MKIKCVHWSKSFVEGGTRITLTGMNTRKQKCIVQLEHVANEVLFAVADEYYNVDCLRYLLKYLSELKVKVVETRMERRRALYGYESWKNCFVVSVSRGTYALKNPPPGPFPFEIFHLDICEKTKLATRRHLRMCDWVDVRDCQYSLVDSGVGDESAGGDKVVCIECEESNLHPIADDDPVRAIDAPLKTLCFDIETEDLKMVEDEDDEDGNESLDDGGLFQISIAIKEGPDVTKKYMITKIPCDPIDDVTVIVVETSKELVETNWRIWRTEDPDVVSGYNILQFDYAKLIAASKRYGVPDSVWIAYLARTIITDSPGRNRFVQNVYDNPTMGRRFFTYIEMEGRANIDLMQFVKKTYPTLPSFSLSAVSKHFLQDDKDDIHYKEIKCVARSWRLLQEGDAVGEIIRDTLLPYANFALVERMLAMISNRNDSQELVEAIRYGNTEIAKYCVVDSVLCCKLIDKLQVLQNAQQMSYISYISLDDVYIRGVQWRITNLLYNFATNRTETPYVLDVPVGIYKAWNGDLCKNFKGATVLEPEIGYFPVVVPLDFSSLYPSIIINSNLCYTTIVPPERLAGCASYETISVPVKDKDTNEETMMDFHFAKDVVGILPLLERMLIEERAKVRAEMKTCSDELREVLDCRQLALKILANSVYGVLGARGQRPIAPIAAVITTIGRQRILDVRELISTYPHANCRVIYGDTDSNLVQLLDVISEREFRKMCVEDNDDRECPSIALTRRLGLPPAEHPMRTYDADRDCRVGASVYPAAEHLEAQARRIGVALAEWVTKSLNDRLGTDYKLAYEGCNEHYLQVSKKCYASTKFGSTKLVRKGILSVRRSSSDFEKRIYDALIHAIFFTDYNRSSLINLVVDMALDMIHRRHVSDFVLTSSFKAPRDYAEKVVVKRKRMNEEEIDVLFIDRNGGPNFRTKSQYDKRMKFSKSLPPNAAVAMNAIGRGDSMMSNSRLEYIYYQTYYGRDFTLDKKSDRVLDYAHYFRNREFFKVDVVEYANRLINPVDKIIAIVCPDGSRSTAEVRRELEEYMGGPEPLNNDSVKIKVDGVEISPEEYQRISDAVDFCDEVDLRKRIVAELPPGKHSITGTAYSVRKDGIMYDACVDYLMLERRGDEFSNHPSNDRCTQLAKRFVSDYAIAIAPNDCCVLANRWGKLPLRRVHVVNTPAGRAMAQLEHKSRTMRCIRSGEYRLFHPFVRIAIAALIDRYAAEKRLITSRSDAVRPPFDAAMQSLAASTKCTVLKEQRKLLLIDGRKKACAVYSVEVEFHAQPSYGSCEDTLGYSITIDDACARDLREYERYGCAILDPDKILPLGWQN